MRRLTLVVGLLVCAATVLSAADTLVRLEGWVVDGYCKAKNANAEGKDCVLECHQKGAPLIFVDKKGTTYALDDQEKSLEFVGRRVALLGLVDAERNVRITKFMELAK